MALNDLTVGEMMRISRQWLSAKESKSTLAGLARVAPWIGDLEAATDNLVASQVTAGGDAVGVIKAKQAQVDGVHDRRLRGLTELMAGLTTLAPELKLTPAAMATLSTQVAPGGAAMNLRSYADEAAEPELMLARVGAAGRQLAESITVGKTTLWALIERWHDSAHELGKLEGEREKLEASSAQQRKTTPRERAARNEWIKVVTNIRGAIAAHKELDDATLELLLGRLGRYESGAARQPGDEPDEVPVAPVTAPVTAPATPPAPPA